MKVSVSLLVENTAPTPDVVGEYGFSAFVSINDLNLLFDTGSSGAMFANARAKNIDLAEIDCVAISHGHFDHTGALIPLLKKYGPKEVFAHSDIFHKRFSLNGENYRPIGCPFTERELIESGAAVKYVNEFMPIADDVYLTGEIPRESDFEDVGGDFWIEKAGFKIKDYLIDDMAMVIDHPGGLVIISGCAHAGIINTINYACSKVGKNKIQAFIGGTHLMKSSEPRIAQTINALKQFNIDKIIVSHCTGFYAASRLHSELGNRVIKGESGMRFDF